MADNHINVTDAKDIALYFYTMKGWRPDANMGRSINTVKGMLKNGYTKDEIISVIDYVFEHVPVDVYSIGYFNHCINETLSKIKKENERKLSKTEQQKAPLLLYGGNKLSRNDSQSNVGTKYNFDLFTRE